MTPVAASPAVPAISTPWLDVLAVGALSLVVLVPLLVVGDSTSGWHNATLVFALNGLINFPHFMASYRLVYRSRATILRYRNATLVVPAVLLLWSVAALAAAESDGLYVHLLVCAAGLYTGIHYTGQAWGMMAAFGALDGLRFEDRERRLVRFGLHALAFWQASRFMLGTGQPPEQTRPFFETLHQLAGYSIPIAFAISAAGVVLFARRIGRIPPARVLLPWISIFMWSAVFASHPLGIFWVQIAHAVQYMIFPARMELNRSTAGTPAKRAGHMVLWYVLLVGAGYFVFNVLVSLLAQPIERFSALGAEPEAVRLLPFVVTAFVNIHHYFTDGCIWKMRDPEVRKDLFAHLRRPT